MRSDVTFTSDGLSCAGWLYVPDDLEDGERRPGVVMAHGFSAVKEMHLANFAEKFEEAGLVVLSSTTVTSATPRASRASSSSRPSSTRTTGTP
jgi:poly(3-hydroxybutyrate) depolymerase